MATHDLEPRDEIDGHLSDAKELLRAAIIAVDDLTANLDDPTSHDAKLPQTIITTTIEKIEKAEKLLEDQELTKRKAA
jgi:hypothetical protein